MLKTNAMSTAALAISDRHELSQTVVVDFFKERSISTFDVKGTLTACRSFVIDHKGLDYTLGSALMEELIDALGINTIESDDLTLFLFAASENKIISASNFKRHLIQTEPSSRELLHRVELKLSGIMHDFHELNAASPMEMLAFTKVMAELGSSSASLIFGQFHARDTDPEYSYPIDVKREPELAIYYLTIAANYLSSAQQDEKHPLNSKGYAFNSTVLGSLHTQLGKSHYKVAKDVSIETHARHYEEAFNALLQAAAYGDPEAIEPLIVVMFDDKSPVPAKGDLVVNLIEKGNERSVPYAQSMYTLATRIKGEMIERLNGDDTSDQFMSDIWFDSISIAIAETYWKQFVALGVLLGATLCNKDHAYYNPEIALELAIQAKELGESHAPIVSTVANSLITDDYYGHESIMLIRDLADKEDIPSMLNWGIHLYEREQFDESLKYLIPSSNKLRHTRAIDKHSLSRVYYYIANALIQSKRQHHRDKINFYLKHSLNGGLLISGISLAGHYLDSGDYLRAVKVFKRTEALESKQSKTGYHPNDVREVVVKELREIERRIMGCVGGRSAMASYLRHMRRKIKPSDKKAQHSNSPEDRTIH